MARAEKSALLRYGSAVAAILIATLVRWLLAPVLGGQAPFLTFFVAVVFAAWYGGFGPAILSLVLGSGIASSLFIPPSGMPMIRGAADWMSVGLFFFVGLASALLAQNLRAAERRAEETALDALAQRQRLRITLTSIGDGVIVADPDGYVRLMNPVAESLTGWSLEESRGRPLTQVFRIVNEQTRESVDDPVKKVLRAGTVVGLANGTVLMAKDGTERPVDDSAAPIRDGDGSIIGVVLVFRDVTERRRAERLRGELAAIVESSDDAIIGTTLDGTVTSWNAGAESIYGYSAEEILGRPILWIIPPEEEKHLPAVHAEVRQGKSTGHFETVRRCKDGRLVDVSVNLSPIRNAEGDIVGVSGVHRDVSEQKRAERELRESEERFHTLADNISQLAWMKDADGWTYWYNRRWWEYTGMDPQEAKGWGWQKAHHPDHVDRVTEKLRRCFETGEEFEDTFPLRGRDGAYHWFLTRAVPIRDEAGRIVRWFGTNTDVTDLMEMEQALKDSDRRKDEFLAMLSHELRNPLAPIRNGLELLSFDGEGNETVAMMKEQVDYLVRLVDDLLDLSRIMQGRVQVHREPVRIGRVVDRAVEMSRSHINANGNELSVSLPSEELWVEGDGVRLAQVITNLLNNAVKYSNEGGRIWLSVHRRADQAELRVRDEGVGIDPEFLPKIFELFSQADRSLDRSQGGLGIGLTLVQNLVAIHGGQVTAHSEGKGRGSEFVVRLPLVEHVEDVPVAETPSREEPPDPVGGRSVLVVDDNPAAATMLARLLERLGAHDIRTAHDGPSALRMLEERGLEIVFLDIGLPGMTGYEVARHIRQRAEFHETLLVALTGYGQDEDRRRSREAGFDEHLVKPPGMEDLKRVLSHPRSRSKAGRRPERRDGERPRSEEKRSDPSPASPSGEADALRSRRSGDASADDDGLRARLERLEEAEARTNRFLGKLAHEVGNLMAPVQLLVRVLERSEPGKISTEEVREMLQEHVPFMNRFYEEVRRISRIARGRLEMDRQPVDTAEVVERAVEAVRPTVQERSQQLTVSLPEAPPTLTADADRLRDALQELLDNAVRFTRPEGTIALAVDGCNGAVEFRVRDEGPGIPDEQLPRIFDLFERGDGEPSFGDGHLGVGLAFARQVVEAHGGRIEVRSDGPGRGSEFVVRLPVGAE